MLIASVLSSGLNCLATKPLAAANVLLNFSQVRYRKRQYQRKYVQPDHRQKLLLAVCEPVHEIDRRSPADKCRWEIQNQPRLDHPYDVLLAKDMATELESSPLVCLLHQSEMSGYNRRLASNEFEHAGMQLRFYNKDIARICMKDTVYEPLLHFAVPYQFTILFAPDTGKVRQAMRITKKHPGLLFLGALVDHRRLLTVKQLELVANMPDLDGQRAILYHTLNSAQQGLLQSLGHHTSQLSQLLTSHASPASSNEQKESTEQAPAEEAETK